MRKIVLFLNLFLFAIFLVACTNNVNNVVDIKIDQTSIYDYYEISTFDITDIKIIVTYKDSTEKHINIQEEMIDENQMSLLYKEGLHNIKVSYENKQINIEINLVEELPASYEIYMLGTNAKLINDLTYEAWLDTIKGKSGDNGKDGLDGIDGEDGIDGDQVEFRITPTHIEWKHKNATDWSELITVELLKGDDAKDPIFKVENNILSYQLTGETKWNELFDLTILKGETGSAGLNGLTPYIGENNHWFLGLVDTGVSAVPKEVPNMDRIGTNGISFGVTIIDGYAGYEVTGYSGKETNIIIPNEIFGQKVISIKSGALPNSITSLSISKHTKSIHSFQSYNNLVTFDFNNANVKVTDYMFSGSRNITSFINLGEIDTIGAYAFYNTSLNIHEFDYSNLKHIGEYAFNISSNVFDSNDGFSMYEINGQVLFPETNYIKLSSNIETIGSNAFPAETSIYYEGNSLVAYSDTYFFKNVKTTEDGFIYIDNDSSVSLINYEGELTEITTPKLIDGKPVTKIERAGFSGHSKLKRIDVSEGVTLIGLYAFDFLKNLSIITLPKSLINLSDASFARYAELANQDSIEINIPVIVFGNKKEDLNFGRNDLDDYYWARTQFGYDSTQIKKEGLIVYIENKANAEIISIDNKINGATELLIPSVVNGLPVTRIQSFAFMGFNFGLKHVEIQDGVLYISSYAFMSEADNAIYINIPNSIDIINYRAFVGYNLNLHVKASSKPVNWDSSWYSSVQKVTFNSEIFSNELYMFEIQNNSIYLLGYLGTYENSAIIIPEKIEDKYVVGIRTGTFNKDSISIVAHEKLTLIESYSFSKNYYYTSVTIYMLMETAPSGWNPSAYYYNQYKSSQWQYVNGVPKLK